MRERVVRIASMELAPRAEGMYEEATRTRVMTSTTVIMISATHAARNHTSADQCISSFREKSLTLMMRTVVHIPPAIRQAEGGVS
jgi:hypothetical protein